MVGLRRAFSSVRVRVTVVAVLAAAVVGALGSALFISTLRSALEKGLVSSSLQEVQQVQAQLNQGEDPVQAVVSGRNDILVQIVATDGTVVASDHEQLTVPLRTKPGSVRGVRVAGFHDRYVIVARAEKGGDRLIAVGRSTEQVESATDEAAWLLSLSVPLGLALLGFAVWVSVGRALRPVEAMRRRAAEITSAHTDTRLPIPGGSDEIPRLAATLNQMLDRVDASQRVQRQFVSDASHELRTPLAAVRQLAEVARDYPGRVDTADLARDVLAEEGRMEELVSALLLLARIEDGVRLPAEEVDLDDVLLAEVRRLRTDGGPKFDVSEVSAGQAVADPVLLRQVVRNLLSNAVRHAQSLVTVSLTEREGNVVMTVEDDGNGIDPRERERIFERFVRLDESRARDNGGAGLGLAIVRTVVGYLGGRVYVTESATGGACFVVSIPGAVGSPVG